MKGISNEAFFWKHTIVLLRGEMQGQRHCWSSRTPGKLPHLCVEYPHSFFSQIEWSMLTWVFLCGNSHSNYLQSQIRNHSWKMFLHQHLKVPSSSLRARAKESNIPSFLPTPPHRTTDSSHQPLHSFSLGGQQHWTGVTGGLIWEQREKLVDHFRLSCTGCQ